MPGFRRLLLLCLTTGIIAMPSLWGQGKREWERSGDAMMKAGDFVNALYSYQQAQEKDPDDAGLILKLAEAAGAARDYVLAAASYKQYLNLEPEQAYPEIRFAAARMYQQAGDYDQWEMMLKELVQDETLSELEEEEEKAIRDASASIAKVRAILADTHYIKVWNAGEHINTLYAESGPALSGDSLVYYSSGVPEDAFGEEGGDQVFRLYRAEFDINGLHKPRELDKRINEPSWHNANPCLSPDGERIYFSRCTRGKTDIECEIWYSVQIRGNWGRARPLDETVNDPRSSNAHPTVVEIEGKEILYFASDREGGMGGWDIWYSVLQKGRPGAAVNLGPSINTAGNEWTPRAFPDQSLYFSSDGHPGLGGYDLFFSRGGLNKWDQPLNLGIPLNTSVDDLWFTPSSENRPGMLVSNRKGSLHYAGETCCYDIFLHRPEKKPPAPIALEEKPGERKAREKAEILNQLLPLDLYFDNDQPDPGSTAESTTANFIALLNTYRNRQAEFENAYAAGSSPAARQKSKEEIRVFFEEKITPAFARLEDLQKGLLSTLREGNRIELIVRGYASPLNTRSYNEKLAARRIASFRNYLKEVSDGALAPYLDGEDALLTIKAMPIGVAASASGISADRNDPRNAIYSPEASQERRISILYGSVDGYRGKRSGITSISLQSHDKLHLPLEKGEHRVLRVTLKNSGLEHFTPAELTVSLPQMEAVLEKKRLKPGEEEDIYVLIRGPLSTEARPKLMIKGNTEGGILDWDIPVQPQ